jgi:gas vesicle protein
MDKILSLLGADKLNEETQGELKEKLNHIIEIEAKKLSEAALEEAKTQLVEEYEAKFDTYKDEITSKFSNFTDGVFEDELIIPEQIQEFAKKGQLYKELTKDYLTRKLRVF